jgi:hypothetical protein
MHTDHRATLAGDDKVDPSRSSAWQASGELQAPAQGPDLKATAQKVIDAWRGAMQGEAGFKRLCEAVGALQGALQGSVDGSVQDTPEKEEGHLPLAKAAPSVPDGPVVQRYKCEDCGHEQDVLGHKQGGHLWMGSGSNWCDKCDGLPRPIAGSLQARPEVVKAYT